MFWHFMHPLSNLHPMDMFTLKIHLFQKLICVLMISKFLQAHWCHFGHMWVWGIDVNSQNCEGSRKLHHINCDSRWDLSVKPCTKAPQQSPVCGQGAGRKTSSQITELKGTCASQQPVNIMLLFQPSYPFQLTRGIKGNARDPKWQAKGSSCIPWLLLIDIHGMVIVVVTWDQSLQSEVIAFQSLKIEPGHLVRCP